MSSVKQQDALRIPHFRGSAFSAVEEKASVKQRNERLQRLSTSDLECSQTHLHKPQSHLDTFCGIAAQDAMNFDCLHNDNEEEIGNNGSEYDAIDTHRLNPQN
jgi:hypothetical protein